MSIVNIIYITIVHKWGKDHINRSLKQIGSNASSLVVMLVAMGVTNRGGCTSSRSSGSPLVLGNQKLRKEALFVGCKNWYLYIVETKPIPPIPAFGHSFVYSYFRYQGLTSLTSGFDIRGLQASLPVAVSGPYRPRLRFRPCLLFAVGKGV